MIGIKIARIKKGLTQKQLALFANTSVATINRIELGKQDARLSLLLKIATILEVSINDLID